MDQFTITTGLVWKPALFTVWWFTNAPKAVGDFSLPQGPGQASRQALSGPNEGNAMWRREEDGPASDLGAIGGPFL